MHALSASAKWCASRSRQYCAARRDWSADAAWRFCDHPNICLVIATRQNCWSMWSPYQSVTVSCVTGSTGSGRMTDVIPPECHLPLARIRALYSQW